MATSRLCRDQPWPQAGNAHAGWQRLEETEFKARTLEKGRYSQRAAPKANNEPAPNYIVQPPEPVTRMSLLDILKDRLGQTFFRLN
jgi:hypothetical protein